MEGPWLLDQVVLVVEVVIVPLVVMPMAVAVVLVVIRVQEVVEVMALDHPLLELVVGQVAVVVVQVTTQGHLLAAAVLVYLGLVQMAQHLLKELGAVEVLGVKTVAIVQFLIVQL